MPETTASPSIQEVQLIRADINDSDLLPDGRNLGSYIALALAEVKRILEDERGYIWETVFDTTNDAYFDNSDSTGRNEDRIKNAISHMAVSLVFRDYAIMQDAEENWTELANYHADIATNRLLKSTLDHDLNEDGSISDTEEGQKGQTFLIR